MANYSVNITDNLDGSYTVAYVARTSTLASGGTNLIPPRASGDGVSTTTGRLNLGDAFTFARTIAIDDLSKNG